MGEVGWWWRERERVRERRQIVCVCVHACVCVRLVFRGYGMKELTSLQVTRERWWD